MSAFAPIIVALVAWITPFISAAPIVYRADTKAPEKTEVALLFTGDMMFDRSVRVAMREKGDDHVFSCMKEALLNADLVIGNLEGPITSFDSTSVGSVVGSPENFSFTFPTSTATLLYRHNIRLVNLGNNHILNKGDAGVTQTKEWLEKAGVQYFGDPHTKNVAQLTLEGLPFSFVSWSEWTGASEGEVISHIRSDAKAGRIVIVYTHWGDEYVPATQRVKDLARQFIDAGAHMVIGTHPHVVQEHEVYNGKHIYYSLGNTIFDQYWEEQVREGLLVRAVFDAHRNVVVSEIPTYLERDRSTCLR